MPRKIKILNIIPEDNENEATNDEIKKSYRDLAKKHGPGILEGFSSFLAARRVFDDLQRYAGAPATQW